MAQSRLARVGAAAGILFVSLMYAGVILGDTTLIKSLPEPRIDASGAERAAYLVGTHEAQLLKAYLVVCAGLCLLVFLQVTAKTVSEGRNGNSTAANLSSALGSIGGGFTVAAGGM